MQQDEIIEVAVGIGVGITDHEDPDQVGVSFAGYHFLLVTVLRLDDSTVAGGSAHNRRQLEFFAEDGSCSALVSRIGGS